MRATHDRLSSTGCWVTAIRQLVSQAAIDGQSNERLERIGGRVAHHRRALRALGAQPRVVVRTVDDRR